MVDLIKQGEALALNSVALTTRLFMSRL